MPKNIDDVILPERRKSIRNIPIPEGRRRGEARSSSLDGVKKTTKRKVVEEEVPAHPHRNETPRRHRSSRKGLWLATFILVLVLVFGVLSMFSGATLSYSPKSVPLTFNNEVYEAAKSGEGNLLYSVVKLSDDKSIAVAVSGEENVSRKASGVIVVYNNASAEPQRLVENTRFESPSGKVYRIAEPITIPGKKSTGPGSIEARVYADVAGAEYNIELVDFTVPGLKGTPRYSTIYARSKTPISGGLVGREKVVSEADLLKAKADLKTSLTEDLMAKVQAEVPADFVLFPALSNVTFEDLPQTATLDGGANVNMRGHLYGIMFKRSELARELSEGKASSSPTDLLAIPSYEGLAVSFNGTAPRDLLPLDEISFKVAGSASLEWVTDEVALKSDLVGRKKKEVSSILQNYPTIVSAEATVRPFWKTSFPEASNKLVIKKTTSTKNSDE